MYFIAIVLPRLLNEKIMQYKNFMLEKFGCKVGLKSPAHITIVPPFWMEDEKEAALLTAVDSISKDVRPFEVVTDNFSVFKPRTIFVAIVPNERLNEVKILSDNFFKQRPNYKIKTDNRPFHPHITIATRDLHKKSFYEAWTIFESKVFKEEWMATGLSVLKHNKKNWDVVHTSQFKNL